RRPPLRSADPDAGGRRGRRRGDRGPVHRGPAAQRIPQEVLPCTLATGDPLARRRTDGGGTRGSGTDRGGRGRAPDDAAGHDVTLERAPGSRSERARRTLAGRIMDGAITPGAPLRIGVLSDELAMSATPVREALNLLAGERLVEY